MGKLGFVEWAYHGDIHGIIHGFFITHPIHDLLVLSREFSGMIHNH